MKHGFKILIATIAMSSALLTACGKSGGGGSDASTPAPAAAPAWTSSFPAGFIGNGTYQGQIALSADPTARGGYLQMAALTGLCGGYGCSQGSYMNIQVILQSGGGYGGAYPGGVPAGVATSNTIGGFALTATNGSLQRRIVYTTGSPAGFSMAVGLYNQTQNGQPPVAGEPSITINGQFTDQTMTVLNVQVIYTSPQTGAVQVAAGTIFGNPTGGYGQPGYGGGYSYGQPGYGGAYTVPVGGGYYGGTGPVYGVGGYYYYGYRKTR